MSFAITTQKWRDEFRTQRIPVEKYQDYTNALPDEADVDYIVRNIPEQVFIKSEFYFPCIVRPGHHIIKDEIPGPDSLKEHKIKNILYYYGAARV